MSFKPFGFQYNPPPTVPAPAPSQTTQATTGPTVVPTGTTSGATSGSQSKAGTLITQLNNLTVMSQYLQDVIVARTGKIAIEIDPAADPQTAKALSSIYGTDSPVNLVSVSMYDKILDAQMGAQQLEMSVGTDSVVQPNPLQVGDLNTVVNTINNHLISSPSYSNWLPLQLASLKSDSIVFQSWADALAQYPAYYSTQSVPTTLQSSAIQASDLDMSDDLYNYQSDAINRFNTAYANVYQSLASPSPVESDLSSVVSVLFQQSLPNMLTISSTLTALNGTGHKTGMSGLQGDMINFSFARLASDTSGSLHQCDMLVSLAINNTSGGYGPLSEVMSSANQKVSTSGLVTSGPMTGMSKDNSSVTGNTNSTLTTPNLGQVSESVKQFGETMNWGQTNAIGSLELLDKSFRQLVERRLTQQSQRQSVMDSQRAMDSFTGLSTGVTKELQAGTLTSNSTPQQQQDAINRILSSLQTGTNTTFVTSGNTIIANPPDMPAVSPPVQSVLQQANIKTTIAQVNQV